MAGQRIIWRKRAADRDHDTYETRRRRSRMAYASFTDFFGAAPRRKKAKAKKKATRSIRKEVDLSPKRVIEV